MVIVVITGLVLLWLSDNASFLSGASAGCPTGGGGPYLREYNLFSPNPSICPARFYTPGVGNPATSTADYFQTNGLYYPRPYDLLAMGSQGAAIAAREGKRYVWVLTPDHPSARNWLGGYAYRVGYSDDPGVMPTAFYNSIIYQNTNISLAPPQQNIGCYHAAWLFFNPDAAGDQIYLYCESAGTYIGHEASLWTTSDFQTMTFYGPVIRNENPPGTANLGGWSSFLRAFRIGPNRFIGLALHSPTGVLDGTALYTSTDAKSWVTPSKPLNNTTSSYPSPVVSGKQVREEPWCGQVRVRGQLYWPTMYRDSFAQFTAKIDDGSGSTGSIMTVSEVESGSVLAVGYTVVGENVPSNLTVTDQISGTPGGAGTYHVSARANLSARRMQAGANGMKGNTQYIALWPIDADFTLLTSPPPIRISNTYFPLQFPGPGYNQSIACYVEDGVLHIYGVRGFFSSGPGYGLTNPSTDATYAQGGGLWQQFVDRYSYVIDAAAAANAAPFGLKASAANGVVTLTWDGALPERTYRVYRGSNKTGPFQLIGDVNGVAATDTPRSGYWWYKVVTLNSGIEQGGRTVDVYSELGANARVNAHLRRVKADGGDLATCDIGWIIKVDQWLQDNNLYRYLQLWTDPGFCLKMSGTSIVRVYDYGTTRLPRGGDYSTDTPNTTYDPVGINNATPSWTGMTTSSHGFYGRGLYDNIQRKIRASFVTVYQKPNTKTLTPLSIGEFKGMYIQHGSGEPGTISFMLSKADNDCPQDCYFSTITADSAKGPQIVVGTYDGTNVQVFANGVAGAKVAAPKLSNDDLSTGTTLRGDRSPYYSSQARFLASGSQDSKVTFNPAQHTATYEFDNNQGQAAFGALGFFEQALTASQIAAFTKLYQERMQSTPTR